MGAKERVNQHKEDIIMKYQKAYIFIKRTTLSNYYVHSNKPRACPEFHGEQDVQLILLLRKAEDGRVFCRIKCPINPLPVKGEFEPALTALMNFLRKEGWECKKFVDAKIFE